MNHRAIQGTALEVLKGLEAERLRLLVLLEALDPNNFYVGQLKPFLTQLGKFLEELAAGQPAMFA